MEHASCKSITLYQMAVNSIVNNYVSVLPKLHLLPDSVLADVFCACTLPSQIEVMYVTFDAALFCRCLRIYNKWIPLLRIIQLMVENNMAITQKIVGFYADIFCLLKHYDYAAVSEAVDLGVLIGEFLNQGAWYENSAYVLSFTTALCVHLWGTPDGLKRCYNCYYQLIHSQICYYKFDAAEITFNRVLDLLTRLQRWGEQLDACGIYAEYSRCQYMKSNYNQAYLWAQKAVGCVREDTCIETKIDVFRHACRAFVVKQELVRAKLLIHKAVYDAQSHFSCHHYKMAFVLSDYGYYLLHTDSSKRATDTYILALNILEWTFGPCQNLHIALAEENLAYSLYVSEYTTGIFHHAMGTINSAIDTMRLILPPKHLIICSANRVKALILEEMSLDELTLYDDDKPVLCIAESLHKEALMVTQELLGVDSVLTAKHYGNLGRLYQTMKRFKESEKMHLKAIKIKECILGVDDYEVGLSIGHLASLYNYHMKEYKKAEELYLRSISISINLFGRAFSGLEYDYKGLINVYENLEDFDRSQVYRQKLTVWKDLRHNVAHDEAISDLDCLRYTSLEMIKQEVITTEFYTTVG